ncbi:hypothetical protein R3P38DRAFT_3321533 [Favolaschia claudopus]|uniref:UvrD-like helicase C-terminal domain-containing protein n=1 Tax=Favolaschia claudopus TaxID=2862362 RepID=A0AAW0ASZ5_9AGAR
MTRFSSRGECWGMPVILRHHNPCPPLGIANGSQGTIADFAVETDKSGIDVHLSGLPDKHVILNAINWSFTTKLPAALTENGESKRVRVKRSQADYEIGYAVTGHSAQGKTLPVVVTDLNVGGSAAYVAASRPTTREGLILIKTVTKSALNKPLPPDLLLEARSS